MVRSAPGNLFGYLCIIIYIIETVMTDMIDCCFMNSDFLEGRAVSVCFMTYFWPFGSVMTDMIDCCFINSDFLEGRAVSVCCMTYFWPFILFNIFYTQFNLFYTLT